MSRKKITISIISALLLIVAGGAIYAYSIYQKMNSSAFPAESYPVVLYIDERKNFDSLSAQLEEQHINDPVFFHKLAKQMDYIDNVRTGRFELKEDLSYLNLIRTLRSARHPIKFTFNNIRFKEDFADRTAEQFMFSSDTLLSRLQSPVYAESLGFDTLTILSMFIPNTYEMYWDISADQFIERMKKEYDRFWNEDRKNKASALGLTPTEVSILASIVEEETAQLQEYPIVAGLYINRLKKGMLLQADPTVKYAIGDVMLQRILFKHLEVDSPYNTYKHAGLPPGPIRIPSIAGLDAVLNYTRHHYLYMCAKEDFSGTHNFARTLSEHNRNARKYQQALTARGIR